MAIKRAIASQRASADSAEAGVADPGFSGITEQDLQMSFHAEYAENDIFPPTDITEDWLKLIDYDPEYVVKIAPVRPNAAQRGCESWRRDLTFWVAQRCAAGLCRSLRKHLEHSGLRSCSGEQASNLRSPDTARIL